MATFYTSQVVGNRTVFYVFFKIIFWAYRFRYMSWQKGQTQKVLAWRRQRGHACLLCDNYRCWRHCEVKNNNISKKIDTGLRRFTEEVKIGQTFKWRASMYEIIFRGRSAYLAGTLWDANVKHKHETNVKNNSLLSYTSGKEPFRHHATIQQYC